VVSEKANTHAVPAMFLENGCPLEAGSRSTLSLNCSHAITFRNELKGVTNIHYDEVLTVPSWSGHLRVRKSAQCSQQLLTDFCAH